MLLCTRSSGKHGAETIRVCSCSKFAINPQTLLQLPDHWQTEHTMGQMLTGGPSFEARQLACPKGLALFSRLDAPASREMAYVLDTSIAFPVHAKYCASC